MEEKLNQLQEEFQKDLQKASGHKELEELRIKYLGRKSALTQLFSQIPTLPKEEKSEWGRKLNLFKGKVASFLEGKLKEEGAREERLDLTLPSTPYDEGSWHVLSMVNEKICSIFEKLGFVVIEGKEIEDEWHNFEALNIPLEHPSRDVFDTFYLDIPQKDKGGKYLLRSHTSPSQIRVMQKGKLPLAVISAGRKAQETNGEVILSNSKCRI